MLRIRQRVDADISTVVGWIADADALNMFTGPRLVWPLTIDQLAAMTATDAVSAWVMIDDRADVIGHFDLALDEGTARIGRVIVDPSRRGRGYGSALVRLAIEEARALGARAAKRGGTCRRRDGSGGSHRNWAERRSSSLPQRNSGGGQAR